MGIFANILITCVFLLVLLRFSVADEDLYKILGVRKSASSQEIKKAYKKLAREWHPDKNRDDPSANERFMKINEAYETLSDREKRSSYDNFGTTAGSMGSEYHDRGDPFRAFRGFESFFSDGPFGFSFGGSSDSSLEKFRITSGIYESKIIPESRLKPYLLFAYADFCYQCMQVQGIWERIRGDLETIGLGVGSVHVHADQPLARLLRISSIPAFVAIVNGKPVYYNQGQFSVQLLRDFIRSLVPANIVTELTDSNYEDFLSNWQDANRVHMIFCDDRSKISMRYLYAAYAHRDQVLAGYIQINRPDTAEFQKKFGVKDFSESLLLFHENVEMPVAHINMKSIKRSAMDQIIESNNYLVLPRLSSQQVFDHLCPPLSSKRSKKICVILLSRKVPDHQAYLDSFRHYAKDHSDPGDRVKYGYIWEDTQAAFVKQITKGNGPTNETLGTLKVAVIWRKDEHKLLYDWLEDGWYSEGSKLQQSRRRLNRLVDWILQSSDILPYVMDLHHDLIDEFRDSLMKRIQNRLADWYDAAWNKVTSIDEITLITAATTLAFMVVIGLMMKSMVALEEEKFKAHKSPKSKKRPRKVDAQPTVYIHPLCTENFEDMLLRTEPGVRTIVILVDEESRHKLLEQFAIVVHPYSRTDAFKFAFLQLEQYLPWYRRLLEETIDYKRKLHTINMKNCIGTVLAINGPRKYYCMYHAYAEKMINTGRQKNGGAFMGFEDDSSDEEFSADAMRLFHSDLLAGFGTWMERLIEGTLKRYRVDLWPNMYLLQ